MRNRRSGVGVIAYNGMIYALGGFNGITRMNTGERYSPETRSWTTIPEMFSPRSNFAIGVSSTRALWDLTSTGTGWDVSSEWDKFNTGVSGVLRILGM